MSCQEFLNRYSEYVDGLLPPREAARLHAHLIECCRCARYDQVMQRGLELARALPPVEPSSDFQLRLQHRLLHARDDLAADGTRGGSGAAVSLALAVLLALAAWGPLLRDEAGTPGIETTQRTVHADAAGMQLPGDDAALYPLAGESAWWAPASLSTPPRPLTTAFPGPYSPLVITPPSGDYRTGVARAVLSTYYSGLD